MTRIHYSALGSTHASGVAMLLALISTACSLSPSSRNGSDTLDREVFIQAYVDLRIAALETDEQLLSDDARVEVLARHGTTAEDLMHFAEVHGRDLEFMRDVWNEVESKMDALRPETEG